MPPKKVQAKKKTGSSKGLKVSIDDEILKDAKKQQEKLAHNHSHDASHKTEAPTPSGFAASSPSTGPTTGGFSPSKSSRLRSAPTPHSTTPGGSSKSHKLPFDADDNHPVVRALKRQEGMWLPNLTVPQIYDLLGLVDVGNYVAGENVFEQDAGGEEQKCMYVLVDGYVKGVQTDGDGVDHRLFSQRAPGYTFGDQSLFGGSPRPFTLVCITKTQMVRIEPWMLEELFQHNMASLEKLRHLSLSTATKSIQMKKGLLLGDLSQAELFHTAERTALIMFFEGDTIIRQGDSRRQHGPYAQQVYILDSGKVDIYVNGVFDETPPEEKDAGEAKRTGSGATAHTDESGANRVDYDPYADLRDLNLPGAGTGFAGAPGAGFEDDPYLTATMPQMAVADDDGEAGWGMYENLEEEMAAKAAAEAAERQAEEEAERARINAEAMARDKATVTLERSDSEDDDEDEEEEEVKENEGGDEEKREGREKDGVDEKGPDAGVEEGKGGAVVEGGAAVEVPKLPKAKRDLVERKVYVCSLDEPGSIFGEVACLMGGSRTATIVASADTKVFCIKKEAIDKLLDEHPETLESILAMVSERREYAAQVLADAGAVEGLVDEVGEVAVDPESTEALQLSEVELMQMFLATKGKLSELNVLDDGEEYVAEIEQLCDNMATSADWADGGGPAQLLGYLQKVYEVFQKEEEEVHRSVADGDTMDKLDSQINRLIRVKDKAEDGLPDTPRTKAERNLRSKTHIRIKKSQLQYVMECLRSKTIERKFTTLNQLCEFVDKNPKIVEEMEKGIEAYKEPLMEKHGNEMGERLYNSMIDWFHRKSEGWTACSTMIGRQKHMAGEIKRLRHQIAKDPESLKGDEKKKIWLMEQGRKEALEIEKKITSNLDAMNKRILTSCFIDSPDLPESCIDSSPLLALAIYLQTIVETKEDSRVAISIMLTTANVHVVDAIDKAKKISEMDLVTAGPSDEDVWAGINKKRGPSGIARDMEGYLDTLGDWLFTKDGDTWERHARHQEIREGTKM